MPAIGEANTSMWGWSFTSDSKAIGTTDASSTTATSATSLPPPSLVHLRRTTGHGADAAPIDTDHLPLDTANFDGDSTALPSWFPIQRIDSLSIDTLTFRDKFCRAPVILTGCDVPRHLTPEYLADTYGKTTVPVEINSAKQRMVLLADYLSFRDPGLSAMYLRNLHMCRWFPDEVAALIVPPCMGIDLLTDPKQTPGLPDEWRHWFELFVSTPSCPGFPVLHVDVCSIHAFSMQLHGVKRFTFFPPGDSPRLYPLPPANTASGLPTNLDAVDLDEFPAFSGARPTSVDLQPGEVLYMPAGWWHTARAVGDSPSVTIAGSFVGEDNIDRFLDDYGDFSAVRSLVARGAAILK
eukprot:m.35738 g.35738  ORF g.35738 m.35738 type:complete len:352 (+) comp12802_c2_seq1:125-1180(+)